MKSKRIAGVAVCLMFFSVCSACAHKSEDIPEEKYVFAMDTEMTLKAYGGNAKQALEAAQTEIERLDKALARGNEDSEVYGINNNESSEASEETVDIISGALDICESTGGAFDITIAPIMDLWGFYTKDFYVPSEEELAEEKKKVDYRNVSVSDDTVIVSNGSKIDLGGIAKGYLSDRIMDIMAQNGVKSGIISLGGNVDTIGTKPDGSSWRVAIQNPDDSGGYIGVLSVSDTAVITSGGYQRFFERDGVTYHHIIDPSTGYPANNGLKSVSIITPDATRADGLSTALFVMGADAAADYWREHNDFEAVFMTDDDRLLITEGIEEIFESDFDYSVLKSVD